MVRQAAIANDLYAQGLESMTVILAAPDQSDPRSQFIEIWKRARHWTTEHREMFAFINAATGAPWLTDDNAARKAAMSSDEAHMYGRLRFDADPDFAAALIGGTLASMLAIEPSTDADEVAARLWRALNLNAD